MERKESRSLLSVCLIMALSQVAFGQPDIPDSIAYTHCDVEDSLGNVRATIDVIYDSLARPTTWTYRSHGNLFMEWRYYYSESMLQVIVSHEYYDGGSYDSICFTYDSIGRCTKELIYDSLCALTDSMVYWYNDSALTRGCAYYLSSGNTICTSYDYEYDAEGRCIVRHEQEEGESYTNHSEYEYDSEGHLAKYTYKSGTTIGWWNEYEYDKDGNMIIKNEYYCEGNPCQFWATSRFFYGNSRIVWFPSRSATVLIQPNRITESTCDVLGRRIAGQYGMPGVIVIWTVRTARTQLELR